MSDLYRLVYASKNLLRGKGADVPTAVAQILEASQRNNAAVGVTGALMFNGGAFAQVLEGPRLGVESTFERIQRDERHGDVTVLQCGLVANRGFTNWSMAFVGQSARGLSLWSRLAAESGFDIARLDGDAVFGMLHDLVIEEEEASESIPPAATAVAVVQAADASQRSGRVAHIGSSTKPLPEERGAGSLPVEARPADTAAAASGNSTDAILAIVRLALSDERQRAADLRTEAYELRVKLAVERERLSALRGERDLWAERAALLASAMTREAETMMNADSGTRHDEAGAQMHPRREARRSLKSVA